ncbi:type II toxin-antitoxin system VapC family toxin [Faucicola boevrei]|uniref:type II toxin-antitoxin system VapC family toxin n=1 Tax=Faucicola boevrei TaxID=346665 RepID=UPI000366BA43|nr:type II toxin-antitoxin system VapC family toxin [Moraxella boevrei]
MAGLDTNSLVRYLTQDDVLQSQLASDLIDNAQISSLFIPITVILKLEWVLRSRYKFDKYRLIDVIQRLISIQSLQISHENALLNAVWLYRSHSADFADCLHTALTQDENQSPRYTFDQNASKMVDNINYND